MPAVTEFRGVTAGSVTTSTNADAVSGHDHEHSQYKGATHGEHLLPNPRLMAGAMSEAHRRFRRRRPRSRRRIAPRGQLHIDRRGLRVSLPFAPRQHLFERVRQELIRGHVLTTGQQFAGGDLVEDRRHLVEPRPLIQDVALEPSERVLKPIVIAADQGDLVAPPHRDGVGDLDRGVRRSKARPRAAVRRAVSPFGRSSGNVVCRVRGA